MERTILADIDSDSRLMFAKNGSGVVLISRYGNINFSAEEFQFYQCLFKLTDLENIGKLRIGSLSFCSVLRRTCLSSEVLNALIALAFNSFSSKPGRRSSLKINDDKNVDKVVNSNNDISNNGHGLYIDKMNSVDNKILNGKLTDSNGDLNYNDPQMVGKSLDKITSVDDENRNMFDNNININDTSKVTDDNDLASLSLHQWLLLCKMIDHHQKYPSATLNNSLLEVISHMSEHDSDNEKDKDSTKQQSSPVMNIKKNNFNGIDNERNNVIDGNCSNGKANNNMNNSNKVENQFANFLLGVPIISPTHTDMILDSKVCGWELSNKGFQKSHVKFIIRTTCSGNDVNGTHGIENKYNNLHDDPFSYTSVDNTGEHKNCNTNHDDDIVSPLGDSDGGSLYGGFGNKIAHPNTDSGPIDTNNTISDNAIINDSIVTKDGISKNTFDNIIHNNMIIDDDHNHPEKNSSTISACTDRQPIPNADKTGNSSPNGSLIKIDNAPQDMLKSDLNDENVCTVTPPHPSSSCLIKPPLSLSPIQKDIHDVSSVNSNNSNSLNDSSIMSNTTQIDSPVNNNLNGTIPAVNDITPPVNGFSPVTTPTITKKKKKKRSNSNLGLNSTNTISPPITAPIDILNASSTINNSSYTDMNTSNSDKIVHVALDEKSTSVFMELKIENGEVKNGCNSLNPAMYYTPTPSPNPTFLTPSPSIPTTIPDPTPISSTPLPYVNGIPSPITTGLLDPLVTHSPQTPPTASAHSYPNIAPEKITPIAIAPNNMSLDTDSLTAYMVPILIPPSSQSPLQSVDISRNTTPTPITPTLNIHKLNNINLIRNINIKEIPNQTKNQDNPSEFESYRRYSDFEILIIVLQKLYKGVILPPLPPKTWASQLQQQTQPSQVFAHQRQNEIQLFLNSILVHPILKYSYELRVFLICSKTGLSSFKNTLPILNFNREGQIILCGKNESLVRTGSDVLAGNGI